MEGMNPSWIPILSAMRVVLTLVVVMGIVSIRSGGAAGKATPLGADQRTPLGATDEGSDAPPTRERIA